MLTADDPTPPGGVSIVPETDQPLVDARQDGAIAHLRHRQIGAVVLSIVAAVLAAIDLVVAVTRTDVPDLVAHVRALRAAVRRVDASQRAFDAAVDSHARAKADAECDAAMLALFALVPEVTP